MDPTLLKSSYVNIEVELPQLAAINFSWVGAGGLGILFHYQQQKRQEGSKLKTDKTMEVHRQQNQSAPWDSLCSD